MLVVIYVKCNWQLTDSVGKGYAEEMSRVGAKALAISKLRCEPRTRSHSD